MFRLRAVFVVAITQYSVTELARTIKGKRPEHRKILPGLRAEERAKELSIETRMVDGTLVLETNLNDRSSQKTILVIEDEDPIRRLIAEFLQVSGYQMLEARDAIEARAVWAENADSIDLVVADLMLPGASGFELAQEFRIRRPDLKIIFASGNPSAELLETTQMMKGSRMLMKPFSMGRFVDLVKEMCGKQERGSLNT